MTWNYICESWTAVVVSRGRKPQKQIAVLLAQPLFLFKNNHRVEKSQCGKSPPIICQKLDLLMCRRKKETSCQHQHLITTFLKLQKRRTNDFVSVCSLCLCSVKKKLLPVPSGCVCLMCSMKMAWKEQKSESIANWIHLMPIFAMQCETIMFVTVVKFFARSFQWMCQQMFCLKCQQLIALLKIGCRNLFSGGVKSFHVTACLSHRRYVAKWLDYCWDRLTSVDIFE